MFGTLMEIFPIVSAVAYVSLSLGVMIKLFMCGVRGPHLVLSFLTPLGFLIMVTAAVINHGKDLPFGRRMRFYYHCIIELPWLFPTTVALLARDLTSNKFLISIPGLFDHMFNDHFLNSKGMKLS
jgi:hypothetical protein